MATIQISPRAITELEDIWLHVSSDRPMAADRLMEAIDRKISLLEEHPKAGLLRDDIRRGARMLVHARYLILYEFDPAADLVEVISVVDGVRNLTDLY